MESISDREQLAEQLRAAERGEAATWMSWEPRGWHSLLFAGWTSAFVLNNALSEGPGNAFLYLALTFLALGFTAWQRRRLGTYPRTGQPPELTWPMLWTTGLFVVVALVGWALAFSQPWWLVVPASALATIAVFEAYRHSFRRASARVRRRLGTEGAES